MPQTADATQCDWELGLTCRSHVYELFHVLFSGDPDGQLLSVLASDQSAQSLTLAAVGYDPALLGAGCGEPAMMSFAHRLATLDPDDAGYLDGLRSDYMRYLAGPLKQDAQPWESFYRSHRQLLFQEVTLQVRDFYRRFGCIPAEYPRVADDHVSLECAFMALLCRRAQEAIAAGDEARLNECLEGQKQFLADHMTQWLPQFAEGLSRREGDSLYQVAVAALAQFCEADAKWLAER